MSYSPQLRTAVLLSGNGTGGAYHAGVLRALHEAGVKIDVVSGRGIGAVSALFAAIDAGAKTWEDGGVWRRKPVPRVYQWRHSLRWAGRARSGRGRCARDSAVGACDRLSRVPTQLSGADGQRRRRLPSCHRVRRHGAVRVFPSDVADGDSATGHAVSGAWRSASSRSPPLRQTPDVMRGKGNRDRGRWWARLVGAPWSTEPGLRHFRASLWQLFRGPATAKEPAPADLSRRYTELLFENLGQPGFRELIIAMLDLETRGDLVFAAIGEARRPAFFQRGRGDLIDLSGVGRSQVCDALAAALCVPVLTEPHLIAFSPESYWKGEAHRTCDRIGAVARLLEELAAAGVEQVIVVCPDSDRSAPHRLIKPTGSLRSRVAEHLSAAETTVVRDAVALHRKRFKGLFLIQPLHNPIGPLDFEGTYDERSDRNQSLNELMDRGYEDAYRQFVEPMVGGAD